MCVGDTILVAAAESGIDENWCLLKNQSTWNTFINGKYLSNIIDDPDGEYLSIHFNVGVTYTKNIVELPVYSNPICYNPKGVFNTLSLGLVHKHHLVTYNSQDGNESVLHISQWPTFNMTKVGSFYHNMSHLFQKKECAHNGEWFTPPPHPPHRTGGEK